jgi:hypothetical protein
MDDGDQDLATRWSNSWCGWIGIIIGLSLLSCGYVEHRAQGRHAGVLSARSDLLDEVRFRSGACRLLCVPPGSVMEGRPFHGLGRQRGIT